ncbi:MAG: Holliday junction branch migration protein RuvA [Clostridiaceae bacterium]|jgi:Holliday junction DNA helicase RuvA|nr:Holliday junction branch migration protein RuvA [Clostridiaceae bacterium]
MYAYIKGKLEARGNDYIILETGGIGYKIATSLATLEAAGQPGREFKVFTYLHVREDVMSLFGFATHEELSTFELLLTVSGVGPKVALSLLSSISPSKFGLAVITDDIKTLTRAPGIGNKMAQRIVLELKDKIKKEQLALNTGADMDMPAAAQGGSKLSEAVSALMVLGYSHVEASKAVAAAFSEELDLESIIRNALKGLVR